MLQQGTVDHVQGRVGQYNLVPFPDHHGGINS